MNNKLKSTCDLVKHEGVYNKDAYLGPVEPTPENPTVKPTPVPPVVTPKPPEVTKEEPTVEKNPSRE